MNDTKDVSSIAGVLTALFAQKDWQRRLGMHEVFLFWDELVGKDVAEHAQPNLIRGSVLWVRVTDPIWMQQLHLQKVVFLEKINERLSGDTITDIRFELAAEGMASGTRLEEKKKVKKTPDKKAVREFEQIIGSLDDEAVKESLRRIWLRYQELPTKS